MDQRERKIDGVILNVVESYIGIVFLVKGYVRK